MYVNLLQEKISYFVVGLRLQIHRICGQLSAYFEPFLDQLLAHFIKLMKGYQAAALEIY